MRMNRLLLTLSIVTSILLSTPLIASAPHYLAAKKAISDNNTKAYQSSVRAMDDYLLKPIAEGEYLLKNLINLKASQIESYITENADLYTSNLLRGAYLKRLYKQNNSAQFLKFYAPQATNTELDCYFLNHKLKQDGIDNQIDLKIEKIWLSSSSRPDSCTPLFKRWDKAGKLSQQRIWKRIELAIKRGRGKMARYLAKTYLTEKQQSNVELWLAVRKDPEKKLSSTGFSNSDLAAKIIIDGLEQTARKNPNAAENTWKKLKSKNKDLIEFEPRVYAVIGYRAAINHFENASKYFRKASFEDEKVRHWAMRTALREQNWPRVLVFFSRLNEKERLDIEWRYWQARALEQTDNKKQATQIYVQIADQRDYYSFLAADRISQPYQMNNVPISVPIDHLEQKRAFQVARELYQVEGASQMRRQWQWAISKLDKTELMGAAKIASNWGFHDRAIITAGKARYFDDVDLRFPLIHNQAIKNQAKKNKLPVSYIYGIMRQESAFIENVRSSAGALGLMQIMPATGRLIWKKQRKSNYRSSKLLDPNTNIGAGSFYLRDMLNLFDNNYAMATAAYNAGPGRPAKWRPDVNLDADIWIENIPFKETRGYVKNVLAYKAIYDYQLDNSKQTITDLFTRINAK